MHKRARPISASSRDEASFQELQNELLVRARLKGSPSPPARIPDIFKIKYFPVFRSPIHWSGRSGVIVEQRFPNFHCAGPTDGLVDILRYDGIHVRLGVADCYAHTSLWVQARPVFSFDRQQGGEAGLAEISE